MYGGAANWMIRVSVATAILAAIGLLAGPGKAMADTRALAVTSY